MRGSSDQLTIMGGLLSAPAAIRLGARPVSAGVPGSQNLYAPYIPGQVQNMALWGSDGGGAPATAGPAPPSAPPPPSLGLGNQGAAPPAPPPSSLNYGTAPTAAAWGAAPETPTFVAAPAPTTYAYGVPQPSAGAQAAAPQAQAPPPPNPLHAALQRRATAPPAAPPAAPAYQAAFTPDDLQKQRLALGQY